MRLETDRSQRDFARSRGFTLIELLVAVTVIGILLGLILPAVQTAREAARRMKCAANLRQIGIAMQSYESAHGMFPPDQLFIRNRPGEPGGVSGLGPHVYLLPYLEQQPLYASVNLAFAFQESVDNPSLENRTARHVALDVYLCPSDGEPERLNNYRFNRGKFDPRPKGVGRPFDGPFSHSVMPRQSLITDGLSRTAFVSERVAGTFGPDEKNLVRDIKTPGGEGTITIESDAQFIPLCLSAKPSIWLPTAGRYWFYTGFLNTAYNHNGSPNDRRPSCIANGFGDWVGTGGLSPPRSYHAGGVNVLLGDGHTEWVSDSIDSKTWTALGTYNAGD